MQFELFCRGNLDNAVLSRGGLVNLLRRRSRPQPRPPPQWWATEDGLAQHAGRVHLACMQFELGYRGHLAHVVGFQGALVQLIHLLVFFE